MEKANINSIDDRPSRTIQATKQPAAKHSPQATKNHLNPQPQTQSKPEPQKHHPLSKFNFYKWLSLS